MPCFSGEKKWVIPFSVEVKMAILDRSYTDVPKLVQKYLKQLQWLERRFRQERPKEGLPDDKWIAGFCRATKLMTDLQREDRQTKAANRAEDLSDKELLDEYMEMLIAEGWTPPKDVKGEIT